MTFKTLFRLVIKDINFLFQIIFFIILTSLYSLIIPIFFKIILDYIIVQKMPTLLIIFSVIIIGVIISRILFAFIQDFFIIILRQKVEKRVLLNYIKEIFHLKIDIFEKYQLGDLVTRFTNIMNSFQYFFVDFVFYCFYALFISILIGIILFNLNQTLFLGTSIFLFFHLLNFVIHNIVINRQAKKYFSVKGENASFIIQFLDGYIQILTSWQQNNYFEIFKKKLGNQYLHYLKKEIIGKRQEFFQNLLIQANIIFIIYFGTINVVNGKMLLGNLFLFILLLNFLYEPIYRISDVNKKLTDAVAQLKRLYEVIDNKEKETTEKTKNYIKIDKINSIVLKDIYFEYNKEKIIFENINYIFKKNNIYLISGQSGIGKSTLFNLIARLYLPTQGNIFFDDIDYNKYSLDEIRNKISICLQENLFFSDTIENNIAFFSEKVNKEHLFKSVEISQSDSFIKTMKNQFNAILLEGGNNLSGGQKQRLNLARTLYDIQEKDVILLDEPTSSLDEYNESQFMKNLINLKKDKIIIIISHRNSIKDYCDEIIHIENKKYETQNPRTVRKNIYSEKIQIESFHHKIIDIESLHLSMKIYPKTE